jgi:hypothetical protein
LSLCPCPMSWHTNLPCRNVPSCMTLCDLFIGYLGLICLLFFLIAHYGL